MKNSTKSFIQELKNGDINYKLEECKGVDRVAINISGSKMKQMRLMCMVYDTNIHIRMGIGNIPDGKLMSVIQVLNNINAEYRFVKFSIVENKLVTASIDYDFSNCCAGNICLFAVARMIEIVDECYEKIVNSAR